MSRIKGTSDRVLKWPFAYEREKVLRFWKYSHKIETAYYIQRKTQFISLKLGMFLPPLHT